jgi:hypothetical protein
VKAKSQKPKRPTEAETILLRRIAQNGGVLCVTNLPEGKHYHDAAGIAVKAKMAASLIANGFVVPQRDSMFDFGPQTWRVRAAL